MSANRRSPLKRAQARNIVREAGRLGLSPTYHHTLSTGYYVLVDGMRVCSTEQWTRTRARLAHAKALAKSRGRA